MYTTIPLPVDEMSHLLPGPSLSPGRDRDTHPLPKTDSKIVVSRLTFGFCLAGDSHKRVGFQVFDEHTASSRNESLKSSVAEEEALVDFDRLLDILGAFGARKPTGEDGFEGLVRKCLENLTGQRFFLSLSTRQGGLDMASEGRGGNFIAAECKCYKQETRLGSDDLLVKFLRVVERVPTPDIWIVVTTKRLGEQHHRDLRNAADRFGISYFAIDAEGGEASSLVALCSAAPREVAAHLKANAPMLGDAEAVEVERYLTRLSSGVSGAASCERLREVILNDTPGYEQWRANENGWLAKQFGCTEAAYAALAQDLAVRAPGRRIVLRRGARHALDDWWSTWPQTQHPFVMLGEEGDGKSWAVADWLADRLRQEGFPPIVFVPSTRISETEPLDAIMEAVRRQIGEPRADYWKRRFAHWLDRSWLTGPMLLLILDGLNERHGFEWRLLLSRLEAEPFAGTVAVLMTCRTQFWQERVCSAEGNGVTWILPPYDEEELTQALSHRGYERDAFDNTLLPLLTRPRFLDLTAKLEDRLSEEGEVTIERLVYEDWRDQMSRNLGRNQILTHEEFQELISTLGERWLQRGILKREDIHGELGLYGDGSALLRELSGSRVLTKEGNRWTISPRHLVLGLGLMLAEEVRLAARDGEAAMDELISSRLEPDRVMDMKVSICCMAVLHALYLDDYPDAGRVALFRAWIQGRNIQPEDWRRFPAYLPMRPEVYIRMAEYLWSSAGENRGAQDVLMSGFLRFGGQAKVMAALIPAFERWMGFVHPDGHRGRRARTEEERLKGREEVRAALGSERESGPIELLGYPLELTREAGWLRLAAVGLAVISHQDRMPFARAFITGALAGTVMGYPAYNDSFNWVLRTSPDAIDVPLVESARGLMALSAPVAQRVAYWLLSWLCTTDAMALRNQIPQEYSFEDPLRKLNREDPCRSLFLWSHENYRDCIERSRPQWPYIAESLREVVLDPHIEVPCQFLPCLDGADDGICLDKVSSAIGRTMEDITMENIEPTLCAWRPERLAEIWRALAFKLPERSATARFRLAGEVYEHLIIMGDKETHAIEEAWRDALRSQAKDEELAENILFACVLWNRPVGQQLELMEQRGDRHGYFSDHPPRFGDLTELDMPVVASRLEKVSDRGYATVYSLLWHLAQGLTSVNDPIRRALLNCFRKGDSTIRGYCLQVFAHCRDHVAYRLMLDEGWNSNRIMESWERHWGSMLLCELGSELPFVELAERVTPALLGYAVQCRGRRHEEVVAYGELVHGIWCSIAGRWLENHPDADRARIMVNIGKQCSAPGSLRIHDGDGISFQFLSWDSVWGGGASRGDPGDLREALDFDAQSRRLNQAYHRLERLAESEQEAGNPWFLNPFDCSTLADVVLACPAYSDQWLESVWEDTSAASALFARCRGFYEALCKALLDLDPDKGVRLFNRLYASGAFRLSDDTTGIDSLLFSLFEARDSGPVVQSRFRLLDSCTTDKYLFEYAFLYQSSSKCGQLLRIVDAWLGSSKPYDRARALTLLGFLDAPDAGDRLREWIDTHGESWMRSCARLAQHAHQRNQWARHWFEVFLGHAEDLRAWAAFRLFLRCVDRRFWLWGPEMIESSAVAGQRILHYNANRGQIRKAAAENEKNALKLGKRLVGCDIKEDQVWPWMVRYMDMDVRA